MSSQNFDSGTILTEGRNCWRKTRANKVKFLIDADAYFKAFASAAQKANSSIYIACWDIDSRIPLLRDNEELIQSTRLGTFLDTLVVNKPELNIYILLWDFSMIFVLEREFLPIFKLGWKTHKRIHFMMDSNHPTGASHHQKIVVVDDSVAFVGGMDLSKSRWDTSDHIFNDPRRIDPDGSMYLPFHDIQVMLDGDAARRLGQLFRRRWRRAGGRELRESTDRSDNVWSPDIHPDLNDATVGIARTEPEYGNLAAVKEVQTLYCDAIALAKKTIYIENQYFTSWAIADALISRLQDPDCPEIIFVMPHKSSGWLEERTMDSLRTLILEKLREADKFDRVRFYYPVVQGMPEGDMLIHSKLMITDDELVRVGSSNLSNRSMGLDTECDIAIEASGEPRIQKKISWLRNRLLAEHLEVSVNTVDETLQASKSLIETVTRLMNSERTLRPLTAEPADWSDRLAPALNVFDPEKPIDPARLVDELVPDDLQPAGRHSILKLGIILLLLLGLSAAWQWGPLSNWLNAETLSSWGSLLRESSMAFVAVPMAYVIGSLMMAPVTLMIGATALIFDPFTSVIYALAGCLASAAVIYGLGRTIRRDTLRRISGSWLNNISRHLSKRSFLTIASMRLIPMAPFPLMNLVLGACRVRFSHYMLGTLIGMAPGIIAISVFAGSLLDAIRNPGVASYASLGIIAVVIGLAFFYIKRNFREADGSSKRPVTSH
jgi:phospholipase D1/2